MANTIQDKLAYLEDTKEQIKQAIVAKGVSVSESDTFRSYADKIEAIETGGGTSDCSVAACFDEVGYTFVPVYIQEGLKTAAQFKAAWNPENTTIDMTGYEDSTVFFPKIDTSKVTTLSRAFENTSILVFPNNDFPALRSNNTMTYLFNGCQTLVSVDFGELNESVESFIGNYMFNGCISLQRIYVHGENTKFTISENMFTDCSKLSPDTEQCNIFQHLKTDGVNASYAFQRASVNSDITITSPKSLYNTFNDVNMNGHNINIVFDNDTYASSNTLSYTFNKYDKNIGTSIGTVKVSGIANINTNLNYFCYTNWSEYDPIAPIANVLDLSNLTLNYGSSAYLSLFYHLPFKTVIGLDTFTENFTTTGTPSTIFDSCLFNNQIETMPDLNTLWAKTKLGKHRDEYMNDKKFLYGLHEVNGTIDLSEFDGNIGTRLRYLIYAVGKTTDDYNITIRLDSCDFSKVTSINSSDCFKNSPRVTALYIPLNFNAYTGTIDFSGLTGWTDHDSLIWSLLTHSTDRTAQSLRNQTIKLSANSYNALTEDEISQIEAKGYSLTHS